MLTSLVCAVDSFLSKKEKSKPTLVLLRKNWCDIVGDALSLLAFPISYRYGTLTLVPCQDVCLGDTIAMQYEKDVYKQKINLYYNQNDAVVLVRIKPFATSCSSS